MMTNRAGFSPRHAREIAYELLHKTTHVMDIQREEEAHLREVNTKKVLSIPVAQGFSS
jgi:hypothetical protein